ncbi:MAG TPA: HNH endonuclease [Anaerolineae bacterium]|nr:HNH endonuclease [Anaerolineae bacterium]
MPRRAPRPCRWPGCPELTRDHSGYCPAHLRQARRQRDAGRPSAARRGYGRRWQRIRRMYLNEHPLCEDPFGVHGGMPPAATEVDHIEPRRQGGSDDFSNLQALCHRCHSRKTALELGWGRGDQISVAEAT